jgi:hypothetical protein
MGFTVYHQTRGAFPPSALDAFLKDASRLLQLKQTPKVCFEYDQPGRLPQVTKDRIRFNGPGDSLGHEVFLLELDNPELVRGFCKTNRKPYTVACLAVLLLAKKHAPKWVTFSDDDDDTHSPALLEAKRLIAILDGKIPVESTTSQPPRSGGILSW